jgi:hypothetical protein
MNLCGVFGWPVGVREFEQRGGNGDNFCSTNKLFFVHFLHYIRYRPHKMIRKLSLLTIGMHTLL